MLSQDDARVGAVRTEPSDLLEQELEQELESAFPQQLQHVNDFGVGVPCSDAVHIAQLHRRALLLDRAFKAKVWRRNGSLYTYTAPTHEPCSN